MADSSDDSINQPEACAIYNYKRHCNDQDVDSQQTLDITLQYRARQCVVRMWRGNVDSVGHLCVPDAQLPCQDAWLKLMRSEERRVGKECRSRWSPYH